MWQSRWVQQLVDLSIALAQMYSDLSVQVHYRAPPDARGSGKERGHGCELQQCPKCEKELKQGKHHVGCFANKGNNAKKRPLKVPSHPPEAFAHEHAGHSTSIAIATTASFSCFGLGLRTSGTASCSIVTASVASKALMIYKDAVRTY